jgi:non-ribosomal peptide synthetase component E (peptide arylation enzyme)
LLEAANSNGVDISSLENFPMGGTGITCEHIRMAEKAGFFAGRVYGSTEHPTVTYSWPHMAFENVSGTDGKIEEANEVRIVDQELNDVAVGQEGEVLTRGPELFVGYLDSSLNQEAFVGDGWFRTGDVGKVDMDNNLTITGRIKDIIIRGGENISALEVEGYINDIEGVAEVAVIGVPDSLLGEVVVGFIKAKDGYEIDASGIIERLIDKRITRQKIPAKVVLVKDFPRTPSGKIKKYELRSNYISDL